MPAIDPEATRALLDAVVTGFSILGGVMACVSGQRGAAAFLAGDAPHTISEQVTLGVAKGFLIGGPLAFIALTIALST